MTNIDLSKFDLTFLIDREKAIQIKEQVVEEYLGWSGMLDPIDESKYILMIYQLNEIIDRLNK